MAYWRAITKPTTTIILFLLVAFAGNVYPKSLIDPAKFQTSDEPVNIVADLVSYDKPTGVYNAAGNVEVTWGDQKLTADRVELNDQTQNARAEGNVLLTKGADSLECEYLEINLETQVGQIKDGKLFYKEGNVRLSGTNLQKVGEEHYILENGDLTTCDGERPPWKISYKKADVTVEGWAKVKDATFKIKNVPVLYTPYLIFPAKTKRQTGFMVPSFGYSSSEGAVLNNEFFWAISESTDATFYLDLAGSKGPGIGSEYRYVTSENGFGRLYGYYANESSSYQRDEYDEDGGAGMLDRGQDRWNLVYEGQENVTDDLFFRSRIDLVSDKQYYADYGYQTVKRTADSIESTAFLTNHWNKQGFSLVGDIEYNKELEEDYQKQDFAGNPTQGEPDPVNRYPQILLTGLPRLLGPTPLFFALDSSYTNFYRNRGVEGSRVVVDPSVTLPLALGKNYRLETESGLLQTAYFDTHSKEQGEDFDDVRTLFHFRTALSTKFMRVFQSANDPRKKYRHTIEPEVSYYYIPHKNDQTEDYPQYDKIDNVNQENRFEVAFTNRLMSKMFRPLDADTDTETEVLYAKIGQAYDASTSDDPFSNSFLELRTRPASFLYFKSTIEYDWYDQKFDVFNSLINVNDNRGDSLSFEYRYSDLPPEDTDGAANVESITTNGKLVLTDWLSVFFRNRQDLRNNRDLNTEVGLDYQASCWGTILTYSRHASTDGRTKDSRIMIEFVLRGIGKVGGFGSGG